MAILLLLLAFSGYSMAGSYLTKNTVVTVDTVERGANCGSLAPGDAIVSVESTKIRNAEDFLTATSNVRAGDYVSLVVNGVPGGCMALSGGDLGFTVTESTSGGLKFGPDIAGAKSYSYSLSDSTALAATKKIIQNRINYYDFPQTKVDIVGDNLRIITAFGDELPNLIMRRQIRATVTESYSLDQGAAKVTVGSSTYIIKPANGTVSINGTNYTANETFKLSNIDYHFLNSTASSMNLEADLYTQAEVVVNPNSQVIVRSDPTTGLYFYYVGMGVTPDANERFTNIIKKAGSTLVPGGGTVLNARLNIYLDNQTVSSLVIPVQLVGTDINSISGVEKTSDAAYNIGSIIFASLRYGSLPSYLTFNSQGISEPTISKTVSYGTVGVGFALMLVIIGFAFYKIKKPKIILWMFVLVLIEIFLAVGMVVGITKYIGARLLIDYPLLVGISFLLVYSALTLFVYFEGLEGRHKHIIVGYKKIISVLNFLRILLIVAIAVGIIGYRGMAFVLLFGLFLDELLLKPTFRTLTAKKI